ncbi:MAG: ABC transporter permease [Roseiarcus sp.]|uniref:ABC transporter permease n=1 Tax=Roseiarcus sp. TaxID=1969460 RepID=UPI003C1A691C
MTARQKIVDFLFRRGFFVVFALIFAFFSLATSHFFRADNILNIFSAMDPLAITASGVALVVMSGRLDISVGSTAFLSCAIGALLINQNDLNPVLAALIVVCCGALLGAINGFIVVVLNVNALVATLSTMIAYRGVALALTDALLVQLPPPIRFLGNTRVGPVPVDIFVMLVVLVLVHLLQTRTAFGRQIMAIGNDITVARKIGLPVDRTGFFSFVLAGVLASIGGMLTTIQNGAVSPFLGNGLEFTAVAVVVVGGISLLGGRGAILFSVIPGAFIFEMIRNGLTNLGADPYSYRLVGGAVIFAAMYADALKSGRFSMGRRL